MQGLVTDDPASGVFGRFDPARMEQIVTTFGPLMRAQGAAEVPQADSLYTNEFIDQNIRMG